MELLEFDHNNIAATMTKVRPAATASAVDLYWGSVQTPEKTSTQEQGRTSVSKPSPEEQKKEWIASMRKPLTTPKGLIMDVRLHEAQAQGVPQDTPTIPKQDVTNPDNVLTRQAREEVKKGKDKSQKGGKPSKGGQPPIGGQVPLRLDFN